MRGLEVRYPRLAETLARADLGVCETPVEWWQVDGVTLLAKRDDLTAAVAYLTLGGADSPAGLLADVVETKEKPIFQSSPNTSSSQSRRPGSA